MGLEYSVIVPTYGEKGVLLLKKLLPLLAYSCRLPHEVIVVDDGSSDEVVSELDKICLMNNALMLHGATNEGFAKACNAGILQANGNSIILCNNDILPIGDVFDNLSDIIKLYGVGLAGCKLLYPNDTVQHAGVRWVNPSKVGSEGPGWFDHLRRFQPRGDLIACRTEFRLCSGALLAINGESVKAIGLLDERFGMACEDIDYNLRVIEVGFNVLYCGCLEAYHLEGATRGNTQESKATHPEWTQREKKGLDELFEKWAGINFSMFEAPNG
jgi:GT2 family glycosyltransferase